jgi:hypothetical protein
MSINEDIDKQLDFVDEDLTKLPIDSHINNDITTTLSSVVAVATASESHLQHQQQQDENYYSEMDSGFQSRSINNNLAFINKKQTTYI